MLLRVLWVTIVACSVVHRIEGAIVVGFDQEEYIVNVGESFEVHVVLDADDATAELESLDEGLFSFGVKAAYPTGNAQIDGPEQIVVVDRLNFFGFSAGANSANGNDFFSSEGNIDQFQDPLEPYKGSLLLTANLTNVADVSTSYPLTLDFVKDLGPGEQQFVDGNGNVLDQEIIFGTATVIVVPEPTSVGLLAFALLVLMHDTRRRTQ